MPDIPRCIASISNSICWRKRATSLLPIAGESFLLTKASLLVSYNDWIPFQRFFPFTSSSTMGKYSSQCFLWSPCSLLTQKSLFLDCVEDLVGHCREKTRGGTEGKKSYTSYTTHLL